MSNCDTKFLLQVLILVAFWTVVELPKIIRKQADTKVTVLIAIALILLVIITAVRFRSPVNTGDFGCREMGLGASVETEPVEWAFSRKA